MAFYQTTCTLYGDDWERMEYTISTTRKEAEKLKRHYIREHTNVDGIEDMDVFVEKLTDKELRMTVTVEQYCNMFLGLEEWIDKFHEGDK